MNSDKEELNSNEYRNLDKPENYINKLNSNSKEEKKTTKMETHYPDFCFTEYNKNYNLSNFSSKIAFDNEFNYEYFEENRYLLPVHSVNNIEYNPICTNGYIRLRTVRGNDYFLTQNEHSHLTPDWKFHVSVCWEDLKKGWNLVSSLCAYKKCWEGCKVMYLKENELTEKGREITVYIYQHNYKLTEYSYEDERSEGFWLDLFACIEHVLEENKIRSNGLANGDLALGKYVSLRNESFVWNKNKRDYIYPLNSDGFNAVKHRLPFRLDLFKKFKKEKEMIFFNNNEEESSVSYFYLILFISLKVLFIAYAWKYILKIWKK